MRFFNRFSSIPDAFNVERNNSNKYVHYNRSHPDQGLHRSLISFSLPYWIGTEQKSSTDNIPALLLGYTSAFFDEHIMNFLKNIDG